MDSIIRHLVEITGHRDHDLLSISLTSAMRELMNAETARVLDIIHRDGQQLLRPKILISASHVDVFEDGNLLENLAVLENNPVLWQGIQAKESVIQQKLPDGTYTWLPVWAGEQLSVCIELFHQNHYPRHLLEVINGMMIVYRNFQNLLDYSERDSLTGLLNRKTFEDSFAKLLRSGSSTGSYAATAPDGRERRDNGSEPGCAHWLAVLDIDHFKKVNDQFGHLYGDEVLILLANILRASFRPADKLFRFGGEEFVILLRATSQHDAGQIFERFRKQVEGHLFPQVGQVTISIGYARIDPFEPAVAIVGRADQALYYAKTHGRNRCCFYDSLVAAGDLHQEHANDIAEFF